MILFDFAPDGYLVLDVDGTIREANCAAASLLNISQHYLVGKPLINFVPMEERRAFRSHITQLQIISALQEWGKFSLFTVVIVVNSMRLLL